MAKKLPLVNRRRNRSKRSKKLKPKQMIRKFYAEFGLPQAKALLNELDFEKYDYEVHFSYYVAGAHTEAPGFPLEHFLESMMRGFAQSEYWLQSMVSSNPRAYAKAKRIALLIIPTPKNQDPGN